MPIPLFRVSGWFRVSGSRVFAPQVPPDDFPRLWWMTMVRRTSARPAVLVPTRPCRFVFFFCFSDGFMGSSLT